MVTKLGMHIPSQIDRVNKKYGNRIFQVAKKENIALKSIITLTFFKSLLKITDKKELPIPYHKGLHDGKTVYFIVDGNYLYNFETLKIDWVRDAKRDAVSEIVYAKD